MEEDKNAVAPAIKDAIRKEAIQQSAKWIIGAAVALGVLALTGWWFYLKPLVAETVGGVPRGAVMAFDRDDLGAETCPAGWVPFLEARARVIVGAGDPSKAPGKMAYDEEANRLQGYVLRQHGGQQVFAELGLIEPPTSPLHTNILPYIALHYCKKLE